MVLSSVIFLHFYETIIEPIDRLTHKVIYYRRLSFLRLFWVIFIFKFLIIFTLFCLYFISCFIRVFSVLFILFFFFFFCLFYFRFLFFFFFLVLLILFGWSFFLNFNWESLISLSIIIEVKWNRILSISLDLDFWHASHSTSPLLQHSHLINRKKKIPKYINK